MKKIVTILLLGAMLLMACEKDEPAGPPQKLLIMENDSVFEVSSDEFSYTLSYRLENAEADDLSDKVHIETDVNWIMFKSGHNTYNVKTSRITFLSAFIIRENWDSMSREGNIIVTFEDQVKVVKIKQQGCVSF